MTDTITKPMQGLAAYLRHASRDVHVGSKSRKTLLDWAREVEAALAAPQPCDAGPICLDCQPRTGSACPDTQPVMQADHSDLIKRLRLGASISRSRNLNLDFAKIADEAADALEGAKP